MRLRRAARLANRPRIGFRNSSTMTLRPRYSPAPGMSRACGSQAASSRQQWRGRPRDLRHSAARRISDYRLALRVGLTHERVSQHPVERSMIKRSSSISNPRGHFDIIAIGSGHNGLVAAAYLAKSGKRVLVLERNAWLGGGVVSRELTRPGFRHDQHSMAHIFIQANPLLQRDELGLKSRYRIALPVSRIADDVGVRGRLDPCAVSGSEPHGRGDRQVLQTRRRGLPAPVGAGGGVAAHAGVHALHAADAAGRRDSRFLDQSREGQRVLARPCR